MATIGGSTVLPLNELANRMDRSGDMAEMAFTLMERNQLIEVIPFREATHQTYHQYIKTLSIPSGTWSQINKGVPVSSSRTKPAKEYLGMIEDYGQIDTRAFRGMKKSTAAGIRAQEDKAFTVGISQTVSAALLYESRFNDPDAIDGILARDAYDALADAQVINSGGSGSDVMSMLVAEVGEETLYGIVPKGTKAGLEVEDLGREPKYDDDGNRYDVYTSHFMWDLGMVLKDERAVVRICNIEDAPVNSADDNGGLNDNDIVEAFSLLPNMGQKNTYIIVNRKLLKNLQIIAKDRINIHYTPDNKFGRKWISEFLGAQIKMEEQLVSAEDALT